MKLLVLKLHAGYQYKDLSPIPFGIFYQSDKQLNYKNSCLIYLQSLITIFSHYFSTGFETFLEWFGNDNSLVYFQHKCHISFKIYGIYVVDKRMLND